jgi:uncharacterized phiE125 gp8 family phage protein
VALNANALVSLAIAKDHLSIQPGDVTRDTRIERFINTASAMIERYTHRKLITQSYVEYLDGNRQNRLLLKQWPITGGPAAGATKPEVRVSDDPSFPAESALDPITYDVDNELVAIVLYSGTTVRGNRNVKVTYTAGLGTIAGGDIPSDLQHACLELTLWYYLANSNNSIGTLSKGKAGETTDYEQLVPQHVAMLLEPYVRHEFHVGQAALDNG